MEGSSMSRAILLAGAMLLASVSLTSAQSNAEIQAAKAKFMTAFNNGDVQGLVNLYAKDAVLLPDHAPRLNGQDAIEAYWKGGLEQIGNLKLTSKTVIPIGPDTAAGIGEWEVTTKGDKPQTLSGKDLIVYRKDGSDWKIVVDAWNADK